MDIGKDIQSCLDDLNNMTHAKLAELLNLSEKTVDRMVAGKGPITKYASDLAKITGKPESWFKENITWEECGKEEVTSVNFEAKNVTEEDMIIYRSLFAEKSEMERYIAYGKFRGVENEKIINMENYRKYKTFNDFMEDIQ